MADYTITAPDGTSWTVTAPDGASEQEILRYAQEQWVTSPEFAPPSPAVVPDAPKTPRDKWEQVLMNPPKPAPVEPAGFWKRAGYGANEIAAGTKQGAAHLGGTVGLAGDQTIASADAEAEAAIREADAAGPQGEGWAGFDGGRMLGKALAAGALPTAAALALPAAPGLLATVGIGAASGLAGGLMEPVDVGQGDYAGQKAVQAGAGALGGAVAGPVASKLGELGGKAVQYAGRQLRSLAKAPTPQQIDMQISMVLQQQGVDFAGLDRATQDYLRDQVKRAAFAGADLDPAATANMATLRSAGVQNPTRAQVSQSPTEYGQELFLRGRDSGRPLADQYQGALKGLFGTLDRLQRTLPPSLDNPAAGRVIMEPLDAAQQRGQQLVGGIYRQANDMPGMGAEVPDADATRRAADAFTGMARSGLLQSLPRGLQERLREIAGVGGINVRGVRDLLETANLEMEGATPAQAAAIGKFKQTMEGMLGDVQSPAGIEAVRGLETARGAAADRFGILDQVPLMRDLSRATAANPEPVSPDAVVSKYFAGAGRSADAAPVKATLDFLRQTANGGAEAADQVKAQVLADLIQKGTGNSGAFLPAGYNKAIRSLDKAGKLESIFTPEEIAMLRNVGKAGTLLEGPPGVPRTGLLGAAQATDWADRLIGMLASSQGRLAQLASVPLRATLKDLPQKAAANRAASAAPLFTADNVLPGYLRRLGATSGSGLVPLAGLLQNSSDR